MKFQLTLLRSLWEYSWCVAWQQFVQFTLQQMNLSASCRGLAFKFERNRQKDSLISSRQAEEEHHRKVRHLTSPLLLCCANFKIEHPLPLKCLSILPISLSLSPIPNHCEQQPVCTGWMLIGVRHYVHVKHRNRRRIPREEDNSAECLIRS